MLRDLLPFPIAIDTTFLAGASLWALALYLSLAPLRDWIETQLFRWLNFADRSLYISMKEFEKSRPARESLNSFYAAIVAIVPFLIAGVFSYWGVEWSLGRSWGISTGILATIGCGIFELGRRSQSED